jgi:hypothetical protein
VQPPRPGAISALARRVLALWDRASLRLGDLQASLHAARHHVVQSIAFSLWRREELMTARGNQPELQRATFAVYQALAAERAHPREQAAARALVARLRWLQPLVVGDRARQAAQVSGAADVAGVRPARRRAALALAIAAALAVLGVAVADAVKFHSLYESRLPAGAARSSVEERSQDHGHR